MHFALGAGQGERQHILRDGSSTADVCVCADAHELMHRAKRSNYSKVLNGHMAGKRGRIGEDHVVADVTVVSNVRVSHDQAITANVSDAATAGRSPMNSDALPNNIIVANLQPRLLAAKFQVLWL